MNSSLRFINHYGPTPIYVNGRDPERMLVQMAANESGARDRRDG